MSKDWTCSQSRRLNSQLREAKEACREKAERADSWRDRELFSTLANTFTMLESRHRH